MNVGIVTSMWSFEHISSCRLILWIKLHRVSPNVGQWQDIGFASISQRVLWAWKAPTRVGNYSLRSPSFQQNRRPSQHQLDGKVRPLTAEWG
jgi:hypothetical protein